MIVNLSWTWDKSAAYDIALYFSRVVCDGRSTKLPHVLAPTFRHVKGSFRMLLVERELPLSLRHNGYRALPMFL